MEARGARRRRRAVAGEASTPCFATSVGEGAAPFSALCASAGVPLARRGGLSPAGWREPRRRVNRQQGSLEMPWVDADRGRVTRTRPLGRAGFDRDDIFGLRRAMASLPESLRDSLMRRWALLGARCEYDLSLVHADIRQEAEECHDPW